MADFLVFQIAAPLASFGSSMTEQRLSDRAPRHAVVSGLLRAALGADRGNDTEVQEINASLKLASLALKPNQLLCDFQTMQAPITTDVHTREQQVAAILARIKSKYAYRGTMVTTKEYLQDGHWIIVASAPRALLEKWKAALEFPIFTLYVGRKSCPLSKFTAPLVLSGEAVEDVIQTWATLTTTKLPQGDLDFRWHPQMPSKAKVTAALQRQDMRTSGMSNHFSKRTENVGTLQF